MHMIERQNGMTKDEMKKIDDRLKAIRGSLDALSDEVAKGLPEHKSADTELQRRLRGAADALYDGHVDDAIIHLGYALKLG